VSRRAIYAIAALAMASALIGCSASSASPAGPTGQQQAAVSVGPQQPATTSQAQHASATAQRQGAAAKACSVLTKDQVGAEFGATFGAGTESTELPPPTAVSSTRCDFETHLTDGNPWTFAIIVDSYPTGDSASGKMTDNRKTTSYTGDAMWAVTEMPGVGDDAIIRNLLTLRNTQENLVVRKGNVIYDFQDTIITGIADSAGARSHLVKLAHIVVG
jgi:hypothetical protein